MRSRHLSNDHCDPVSRSTRHFRQYGCFKRSLIKSLIANGEIHKRIYFIDNVPTLFLVSLSLTDYPKRNCFSYLSFFPSASKTSVLQMPFDRCSIRSIVKKEQCVYGQFYVSNIRFMANSTLSNDLSKCDRDCFAICCERDTFYSGKHGDWRCSL